MTKPLSPAAQAVLDAFLNGYICKPGCNVAFEADRNGIAAALKAVAEQVVPLRVYMTQEERSIRDELRALAAELEGGNG
jgi:hypothetical protein